MDKLTEEQCVVLTAFTGVMMVEWPAFQVYAEKILGRPIFTHEFGSYEVLAQIREAARDDFMALLPDTHPKT